MILSCRHTIAKWCRVSNDIDVIHAHPVATVRRPSAMARGWPVMNQEPLDLDELGRFALHVWQYREGELVALTDPPRRPPRPLPRHVGGRADHVGRAGRADRTPRALVARVAARSGRGAACCTSDDGGDVRTDAPRGPRSSPTRTAASSSPPARSPAAVAPEFVDSSGRGLPVRASACPTTRRGPAAPTRPNAPSDLGPARCSSRCCWRRSTAWSAKLEAGARVADVGCGGGLALTTMARRLPRLAVSWAIDPSRHARRLAARDKVAERAIWTTSSWSTTGGEELPRDGPASTSCSPSTASTT